jgi:two-component system sensor histidine kinase KdpD
VTNLLEMTRLQAGALVLRREAHSLEELIGSAIASARAQLRGRAVETSVAPALPLVPMDEMLMRQVLVNLLDNAAKHSPEGAAIAITARLADREVVLEVLDRGPGFAPGEELRAFEKFYRGVAGTAGIGLGLTIARELVLAHGGTIAAANREGGGARVRLTLPLAARDGS